MAKDPAFLFYSQDFFIGTSTMSFEDRGKYITVLCLMHQQGRMLEQSISFVVGLVSVNLRSKFLVDENGFWYNDRLEAETEKRNKFTESRRNNGLLGGKGNKKEKRKKKNNKASAKLSGGHSGTLMENENENAINKDIININKKGVVEKIENAIAADHEFILFVKSNFPNVCKITRQLTDNEAEKLVKNYPASKLEEILAAMDNKPAHELQRKYTSVYLTILSWIRLEEKKGKPFKTKSDQIKENYERAERETLAYLNRPISE